MNSMFRASVAAVLSKTSHSIVKASFYGGASSSTSSWKKSFGCAGIETSSYFAFEFSKFQARCYSAKVGTGTTKTRSRKPKAIPAAIDDKKTKATPTVVEDNDEFFVVRKGDVVGVYKSFSDCQAQVGSSVRDPPVSIFKGYSMTKDTEEYLLSRGLKNPLYTIRAGDLKQELFGTLVPCPFQLPDSTIAEISGEDAPEQTALKEGTSTDPLRKDLKLDGPVENQVPISDPRTCYIEFDGASKGNPGQAGAGAVLRYDNGTVVQGKWKAKAENMADLLKEANNLKKKFDSFKISHVLRAFNSEADAQANLGVALADGEIKEK